MYDYYHDLRPDTPYLSNGGSAGWSLHQRGPVNDFDIIQSQAASDFDQYLKDKGDRASATLE
jgi:hypothetical protein